MGKKRTRAGAPGGWSSLPWRPTGHRLAAPSGTVDGGDGGGAFDEDRAGYNHYDDPGMPDWGDLADPAAAGGGKKKKKKKKKKAPPPRSSSAPEEQEGGDLPGFLLGFDVVDASQYEVRKEKLPGGGEVASVVARAPAPDGGGGAARGGGAKKRKAQDDGGSHSDSHNEGGSDDDNGGSHNDDDDDDEKDLREMQTEIKRLQRAAKRKEAKLRKKKQKKKQTPEHSQTGEEEEEGGDGADAEAPKQKQPAKKEEKTRRKKKKAKETKPDASAAAAAGEASSDAAADAIRTSWSVAAPGVVLHRTLCGGLAAQGFMIPTPIQAATLPAAILGRRDIVGAAPTGSGKTLSYALPMLQGILAAEGAAEEQKEEEEAGGGGGGRRGLPLMGLVLCPTRELAIQVTTEIKKVACGRVGVGTMVGGLAEQKQKRVLDVKRPPILVATPGRLWELVSARAIRICSAAFFLRLAIRFVCLFLARPRSCPCRVDDDIQRLNFFYCETTLY